MVSSLIEQLLHGVRLVDLAPPPPRLTISAVWAHRNEHPAIDRLLDITTQLANKQGWI